MEYVKIDDIISNTVVYEEYFEKHNGSYSREFIYKFKEYILIKNIVYPLFADYVISCELIDLSEDKEEKIIPISIDKEENSLKIFLNNNVKVIKIVIKCRKNIFPNIHEIKMIKDIHKSM